MESEVNLSVGNYSNLTKNHAEILNCLNDEQFLYQLPAIVYTSLLMCIGTPGNIVVFYVYFFKWRKSTSRMFILFLTGLDLVNCVTTLPMEIFIMRYSIMLDIPWLCKISRFSTYTMNSASAAILVAIAVDRFKRICRPHGSQFTSTFSKHICMACLAFVLLLTWPAFILYGTRKIRLGDIEGRACLIENQFDNTEYPYIFFIFLMASTVVIFTTLSILYYFVGLQIYRHRKFRTQRKKMALVVHHTREPPSNDNTLLQPSDSSELRRKQNEHIIENGENIECKDLAVNLNSAAGTCTTSLMRGSNESKEVETNDCESKRPSKRSNDSRSNTAKSIKDSLKKLNDNAQCIKLRIGRSTLMLFLITLAYIISFLPFYILAIIRHTDPGFRSHLSDGALMTYHVLLRSYLLSSAINPIIYSFCNSQFRTFCFNLFRTSSQQRTSV